MKKQKKRLLVGLLLLAAAALCGGRIYAVNASAQKAPPSVYYAKGKRPVLGKIFSSFMEILNAWMAMW